MGHTWRPIFAALMMATMLVLPKTALADCEVTETGIPEDAIAPIDIGGARRDIAEAGIGIGGTYYGEFFANSGGVHQGGEYDGGLKLYLNAEMQKLGFWKGLCFFRRRVPAPWRQHHRG